MIIHEAIVINVREADDCIDRRDREQVFGDIVNTCQ